MAAFYIPSYGKTKSPPKGDNTTDETSGYAPTTIKSSGTSGFYIPDAVTAMKNHKAQQEQDDERQKKRQEEAAAKVDEISRQGDERVAKAKSAVYNPINIAGDVLKAAGGAAKAGANVAKEAAVSVYNSGKNTIQNAEKVIESSVKQNDYSAKVAAAKDVQNYIDSQLKKGLISQETANKKKQTLLGELNKSATRSNEAVKRTSAIDPRQAAADAADTALNIGTLGLGSVLPKAAVKGGVKAAAELAAKNIGEKAGTNTTKKLAGDVAKNAVVGGAYGASSAGRNNDTLQNTARDIAAGAAIGGAIPLIGKAISGAAQKAGLGDIAKNVFSKAVDGTRERLGRDLTPVELDGLAEKTAKIIPSEQPKELNIPRENVTQPGITVPTETTPKFNAAISDELKSAPRIDPTVINVKADRLKLGADTIDEAGLDNSQVQKYVQEMKAGKPLDPIVVSVGKEGELLVQDGKHRLAAAEELGIQDIPVVRRLEKGQLTEDERIKQTLEKGVGSNRPNSLREIEQSNMTDAERLAATGGDTGQAGLQMDPAAREALLAKTRAAAAKTNQAEPSTAKEIGQKIKLVAKEQTPIVTPDNSKNDAGKLPSRVFERMQAEQPEALQGDLKYTAINLKEEAAKAVKLIEEDKQKAYRVAMGIDTSAEHTQTGVNIAMSEQALAEGNNTLFAQLIKKRSLDQTRRGQEIVSERGSIADNSTSRYVRELLQYRMEKVGRTPLGELKLGRMGSKRPTKMQNAIEHVNKEVAKAEKAIGFKELDIKSAQAIIDGLACK